MRQLIRDLRQGVFLLMGLFKYWLTSENSHRAHLALVYFFCRTGGSFNEWFINLLKRFNKPLPLITKLGVIGDMSGEQAKNTLVQLQEKGYVVFEQVLDLQMCDRLRFFAENTPARVRPMDGESQDCVPRKAVFTAEKPLAVRYEFGAGDLLANPDIQALLADPSLLALAEAYLGVRPRTDVLTMWWHVHFHDRPDSEAAQMYHFDLDRLKWLKIFIYLTDVGPNDGPHSFIEGTHVTKGIPSKFLQKGYVRLSDEEVESEFDKGREKIFVAPRGTIIIEDTRGLHKGSVASGNPRLMLQLQLSASLFGAIYPKVILPDNKIPDLAEMIKRMPDVYKAYL